VLADKSDIDGSTLVQHFAFDVDACAIVIRASLGRTILSNSEWAEVRLGDTVFVEGWRELEPGELELSLGPDATSFGACRLDGRLLRITRYAQTLRKADMLQTEASGFDGANAAAKLEQLQVELRFEIGSWRTTVGTLRELGPDAIVELGHPVDGESVTIWVERQCVGRGRVVVVGDRLGVQIVDRTESAADGARRND